jgi:hypothetical protein
VSRSGALTAPTVLVNALGNILAGELMSRGVTADALIALGSLAVGASGAAIFLVGGPLTVIFLSHLLGDWRRHCGMHIRDSLRCGA